MKRKLLKSFCTLFTVLILVTGTTSCGTSDKSDFSGYDNDTSEFDAVGYVKSVLDANYHHEYTEYAKYRDISEADAKEELEKELDTQVDAELSELDDMGAFSETEKEEYKTMIEKIQGLASYEVTDASKDKSDNFSVTLKLTPSNVYQTIEDNMTTVAQEMAEQEIDITEASNFQALLIDSIQTSIDGNVYGKPVTINIKLTKDSDDAYGISDADMQKINETLFPE